MKKNFVLYLLSLLLLYVLPLKAQTIRRTDKTPGFFVPSGALNSQQKTEKLPPVEAMTYRGQQAPVLQEIARRQQLEQQQKLAKERAAEITRKSTEKVTAQTTKKTKTIVPPRDDIPDMPQETVDTSIFNNKSAAGDFATIVREYKRDVKLISENKPFSNERLKNMIADYKDVEHKI